MTTSLTPASSSNFVSNGLGNENELCTSTRNSLALALAWASALNMEAATSALNATCSARPMAPCRIKNGGFMLFALPMRQMQGA